MKKISKIGLLLISFIAFINVTYAKRSCDVVLKSMNGFNGSTSLTFSYKDKNGTAHSAAYHLYTLSDSNGEAFTSYCRHAGRTTGNASSGTTFKCVAALFDPNDNKGEDQHAYDAGVLEILKYGYSTRNPYPNAAAVINGTALSTGEYYAATNVALRVFEMFWAIGTNRYSNTTLNQPHLGYANAWMNLPNIKNKIIQATGGEPRALSGAGSNMKWTNASGQVVTRNVEDMALLLLERGLDGSIKYRTGNGVASLVVGNAVTKKEIPTTDSENITTYKLSDTYKVSMKNFKSSNPYVKVDFSCPECATYGVQYEIFINDQSYGHTFPSNLLTLDSVTNGTGDVEIRLEFVVTTENYNCETVKYDLNFEYRDDTIDTEAYDVTSSRCTSNSCQHFYVLYADDVALHDKKSGKIKPCVTPCSLLEQQCDDDGPGSDACQQLQDEFPNGCATCTAYVGDATCSDTDSEFDILEGYESTSSCTQPTVENIKSCVIGNEDNNGNSYQATDLVSNKYCNVWCKEDYTFRMPSNQSTNSDRYFQLKAGITGTKTCYTSMLKKGNASNPLAAGNEGTFEYDYEVQRQAVLKAYFDYIFYYTALNNHGSNLITDNPQDGATHDSHYYDCDPCPGNGEPCPSREDRCSYCSGDQAPSYNSYKYEWSFVAYNPTSLTGGSYPAGPFVPGSVGVENTECTSLGNGTIKCTYEDLGSSSCSHTSCSSTDGKDITEVYNATELARRQNVLSTAIGKLNQIVRSYNSCATWTMDYNFDPVIKFDYEEDYMTNVLTDRLQTTGDVNIGGVTTQRCTAETDDSYENCPGSNWNTGGSTTSDATLANENKFICTESSGSFSCSMTPVKVTQTRSMKETITAAAQYITPTQFFSISPTSEIVVADENAEIENSNKVENALPVGVGTRQGKYKFALLVENLGEYYDTHELGRIWGDEESVYKYVMDETSYCRTDSALVSEAVIGDRYHDTGAYVCEYLVNIPTDDNCPDCPVVCPTDDACYREDPNCPNGKCPVTCPQCLYNDGLNLDYRPVTPDDVNPNDRNLGNNWNSGITNSSDPVNISTSIQLKAYATTEEIERVGESIYDVQFDSTVSNGTEDFAMEVTLDGAMMAKIREYNSRYADKEGYANNTLKCYDYTASDGTVYKNVYCYSTFIDELLYDNSTRNKIKIKGNRIIGSNAADSNNLRKAQTQTSGYWTTWDKANTTTWNITTTNALSYYTQKFGYDDVNKVDYGIGPSWK